MTSTTAKLLLWWFGENMVTARGLIVYERPLDAFCGKLIACGNGSHDFATSDVAHRAAVFAVVRGNVCGKTETGVKATGNGMIAISNWHPLTSHY